MDLEQGLAPLDAESFSSSDDPDASLDDEANGVVIHNDNENSTLQTAEIEPVSPGSQQYREYSVDDNDETKAINDMFGPDAQPCCQSRCNSRISLELAMEYRQTFSEYSRAEQDQMILSHLEAHKEHPSLHAVYEKVYAPRYGKKKTVTKGRCNVSYYFRGLQICKSMYFFIHPIGKTRYENIQKHFNSFGIIPRIHGLQGKPVTRSSRNVGFEVKCRVVEFIKTFAEKYAVFLPGRTSGFTHYDVLKLPAEMTKTYVHNEYIMKCCSENDECRISNRSFRKLWNTYCPYITTMKPNLVAPKPTVPIQNVIMETATIEAAAHDPSSSKCVPKKAPRKKRSEPGDGHDCHGEAEQAVNEPYEPKPKTKQPRKVSVETTRNPLKT